MGLQADRAHRPVDFNLSAKRLGHGLQPSQDVVRYLPLGQYRPAALRNRAAKAHVDRVEFNVF
ncbi:hypothetical protein [Candidatus Entotheonella palauensis]|uniref:hypothetical protein n=1 Tax=Candidatus Entotheonella palauensis TaxID=93172 RepID=UPI000B7FC084|nr:hypothetical protein [Candidatus Entotheonella palauensis]